MVEKISKPKLSFWQIWNVSFGFLGVQFGFALQNANVSRILSDLGADLHSLSLFWLAAPVMGLIVQPIVGGASDLTWNKLGRRGPFILGGAFFAALGMYLMPNAALFVQLMPAMLFGGLMLALMDGSFNVTMQPFRALVADMVPESQRNLGYSVQSFLINVGAVIGSALPFILTNVIGLDNSSIKGDVAPSVKWAFYIGATVLLLSVLWTVFRTKEYPPEKYYSYQGLDPEEILRNQEEEKKKSIKEKLQNFWKLFIGMPTVMKQLALVQFFSWFGLYIMWVYTTPAIGQYVWGIDTQMYDPHYGTLPDDVASMMGAAGDWVGILFAAYSLFAALYSTVMAKIADKLGRKVTYAGSLLLGGLGFLSFLVLQNPELTEISILGSQMILPKGAVWAILPMIGIGVAWAAILAMPYAILSNALPIEKMGIYMGIFNFTIAVPQIISGLLGSYLISLYNDQAIYMLITSGVAMLLAAGSVYFVKEQHN